MKRVASQDGVDTAAVPLEQQLREHLSTEIPQDPRLSNSYQAKTSW